jgi:hypothetical protein
VARKPAIPISVGALLLIASAAGFVIVPDHKAHFPPDLYLLGSPQVGWSSAAYEGARIGTWALLIVGGLLVAIGLIHYARPR